MGTISMEKYNDGINGEYNRAKEVKAFDETKLGVKGLVDSGLKNVPNMFVRPSDEILEDLKIPCVKLQVPVISFEGIDKKERYDEIVKEVLHAVEKWGFFQVVNHGIPLELLDNMLKGVKMFHEQDAEVKKEFYTREFAKQVVYVSNYDLYQSGTANWRDSLAIQTIYNGRLEPEALPEICRDVIVDYSNQVLKMSDLILELLSVALELRPDRLKEMECNNGWILTNHYYPACPAPEMTIGTGKHFDPSFFTVLLQDQIGGLQVLHENQWVEVQPIPGAFVVNIGDILQMMSNNKFKSVYHRVTANQIGPRISVALFLKGLFPSPKLYGPIEEILSDENPPLYREFTLKEFQTSFLNRPLNMPAFEYFKIQNDHGDDK